MTEPEQGRAAGRSADLTAKQSRLTYIASRIPQEHYRVFHRAIVRVTSTELAQSTFSQIVDGLPTWRIAGERRVPRSVSNSHDDHPLQKHTELCDGVVERTQAIISAFDYAVLPFDINLLQAYAAAAVGSKAFHVRLIELIANAVHQIGVYLFQNIESLHKGEGLECWKPPPRWRLFHENKSDEEWILDEWPYEPFPTLFCVSHYHRYKNYPDGLADVVGYWAEDRILGGITLFDRGTSGLECNDIWWHSGNYLATNRICRLTDQQVETMITYLVSETAPPISPYPVFPTTASRDRIDVWDRDAFQRIHRDPWERKVARKPRREHCVIGERDYPEIRDEHEATLARFPGGYNLKAEDLRADHEKVLSGKAWKDDEGDTDSWL